MREKLALSCMIAGCGFDAVTTGSQDTFAETGGDATTSGDVGTTFSETSTVDASSTGDDEPVPESGDASSTGPAPAPGAETLWEKFLARPDAWVSPCDLAIAPDGSFAVSAAVHPVGGVGDSGFVAWFDPAGTLLREHELPHSVLSSIAIDAQGQLWGVGNGEDPPSDNYGPNDETTWGTWLKLDADGEMLWEVLDPARSIGTDSCGPGGHTESRGAVVLEGEAAWIYRYDAFYDPNPGYQEIIRIDEEGQPHWTVQIRRNPPGWTHNIAPMDGSIYVVGNIETGANGPEESTAWLTRIDEDGNVAWERERGDRESHNVVAGADGALYWLTAEYKNAVAEPELTVEQIDPETGDALWTVAAPGVPALHHTDGMVRGEALWVAYNELGADMPVSAPFLHRYAATGAAPEEVLVGTTAPGGFIELVGDAGDEAFILAGTTYDDARLLWIARAALQ